MSKIMIHWNQAQVVLNFWKSGGNIYISPTNIWEQIWVWEQLQFLKLNIFKGKHDKPDVILYYIPCTYFKYVSWGNGKGRWKGMNEGLFVIYVFRIMTYIYEMVKYILQYTQYGNKVAELISEKLYR